MSEQRFPTADEVWHQVAQLVRDHRDPWRRAVARRTGLPFSRIRMLRRLAQTPMSVKQLAEAATVDAPAATVAVNDLEARGLVAREIDPTDRRSKVVSLTAAGLTVLDRVATTEDPAPEPFSALSPDELATLSRILTKVAQADASAPYADARPSAPRIDAAR